MNKKNIELIKDGCSSCGLGVLKEDKVTGFTQVEVRMPRFEISTSKRWIESSEVDAFAVHSAYQLIESIDDFVETLLNKKQELIQCYGFKDESSVDLVEDGDDEDMVATHSYSNLASRFWI